MYTEDQLYDMLDTSVEQQLSFRVKTDFLGVYDLKPREVYGLLTDTYLDQKIEGFTKQIIQRDKDTSEIGLREEVLKLGFEERYYGLRYAIEKIGTDIEGLMYEVIKKMMGLIPKEVLLLSKRVRSEEEYRYLYERIYQVLVNTEADESDKEILYIINNQIVGESLYEDFVNVMGDVVERLHLYHDFVFKELYYTPQTLRVAIRLDIEEDLNGRRMKDFPIKEYLEEDDVFTLGYKEDDLYIGYMEQVVPLKETIVLGRLWEDIEGWLEEEDSFTEDEREFYKGQFSYGKYLFNGEKLLIFRDGLVDVSTYGEFSKIASSRVRKKDLEELQQEFIGGLRDE